MRIAICEDNGSWQELLKKYISEWAQIKSVPVKFGCFDSAESFLFFWEEDKAYDLLILDIEMKEISGMDLAVMLRQQEENVPILFVTGYDRYMAQGYEVAAVQYLLKPLQKEKLFVVLDRIIKEKKPEEKLMFEAQDETLLLSIQDILYLEAEKHHCILYTRQKAYRLRNSFSAMTEQLAMKEGMLQCHRSYLVNLQHIQAIARTELVLDDMTRIPVSRSLLKTVNEKFKEFYGIGR